jgi:hypothetical protein
MRGVEKKLPKNWKSFADEKAQRACDQIKKSRIPTVTESVLRTIWQWADSHESFPELQNSPQSERPLDPLFNAKFTAADGVILNKRVERVCSIVIFSMNEAFPQHDADFPSLLLGLGLISKTVCEKIGENWSAMATDGRKYESITRGVGGYGALVFFPHTSPEARTYHKLTLQVLIDLLFLFRLEHYLPSDGPILDAIIQELCKLGVPAAAEKEWSVPGDAAMPLKRKIHDSMGMIMEYQWEKAERLLLRAPLMFDIYGTLDQVILHHSLLNS